ncbi:RNA polymerase sigma factor [Spongiactinospora sp. 9N601]|uniref:RNA polymerase sigma factor n=1 Tax=Spongiactinospora sp. 9N601 TaxID=3375149 RepID=UPI0037A5408E
MARDKGRARPCSDEERIDVDLLASVASGHMDALRLLQRRHAAWLRARLARRCSDSDLVDDALQDTFVALWQRAGEYDAEKGHAAAWLWSIAIRRLISRLRAVDGRWISAGWEPDANDALTLSAEDALLVGVEHGDVGGALRRLAPELRAVIQATVVDGLTVLEAAHILGIPPGTVKSRARRARLLLREYLS